MLSKSLIALATVSASGALAATPVGFEPGSQTSLLVTYGNVSAQDGVVVAKDSRSKSQVPNVLSNRSIVGEIFSSS